MPNEYLSTVKIWSFDLDKVLDELRHSASELAKKNPAVEKVLLFGSLVKGNYAPGSDADILVILKQDSRRIIDRISEYLGAFSQVSVAVDVFPYTAAEVDKMLTDGNLLIQRALKEGMELQRG